MHHDGRRLDLQAAAGEIGVHYQTAYRWVRTGRLRAQQVGGRYLIERGDLDAFVAERARPQAPTRPSPKRMVGAADKMYDALVDGDEVSARKIAHAVLDEGTTPIEFVTEVLVPPLRRIGDGWHAGLLPIWVEHRASSITERLLGDIAPNPRGRRRGTAMVAAVAGERHALPASMAAVALRGHNWRVHHLGADIPTDELVGFIELHDVDLAVLTRTNSTSERTAADAADQLRATGVAVIVGGPGRTLDELLAEATAATRSPTPTT